MTEENKHLQRAEALCELERWREAIHEAIKYLVSNPQSYRAVCVISRCHLELDEYEKSLEFSGRAIEINPTKEWAYRLQSIVYKQKNDNRRRMESALQAVKTEPESTFALQVLTYAQLGANQLNEAESTARKIRQLSPDSIEAYKTFGFIEYNRKNFNEAENYFRQALRLEPTNYETLNLLGDILLKKFEKAGFLRRNHKILYEAIDFLRQAVTLNPIKTEAKSNLILARTKLWVTGPIKLLPPLLVIAAFIIIWMNRELSPHILPDIVNLHNQSSSLFFLYLSSWVCLIIAVFKINVILARKRLSEINRNFIEKIFQTTNQGKIIYVIWLIFSIYPLFFIVYKLTTGDFKTFQNFKILDWITLLVGIAVLVFNCIFIFPDIFKKNFLKSA